MVEYTSNKRNVNGSIPFKLIKKNMKSIFYLFIQFIHQKFCLKLIQLYNSIININVFYGFNSKNTYLTILNLKLRISSFLNNIVSILKIFYLKFRFKLQNLNTSLNIKLKIILGKKLYPMMLLLFFNFNSLFVKFIYMYLNIVSILFGIVLSISLYSLTNIITFVSILFCLLVFSSFIIFVREFNINFTTSFIQLIIERDYSKYLQKIILIKFLLFYIYITSDFSLCESTWSKFAHDVFIGVGNQIGVQPKTTVSTLETVGIIAILGTISVGSIHLYNWSTGNVKTSIDERLNAIEYQLNQNSRQLINISECQRDYAEINANAFTAIGTAMHQVESNNINVLNELHNKVDNITSKINTIEINLADNQYAMEQYINLNVKEKLVSLENKFTSFSTSPNLTDDDRKVLSEIGLEINNLSNHVQNIPQSTIERTLSIVNSPELAFRSPYLPSLNNKTIDILNQHMRKQINTSHHRSHSTTDMLAESKVSKSTAFEQYQTVKFLVSNNKIVNVSIEGNIIPSSNIITSIGSRVFNHIPVDVILKTVSTAITSTLAGTMTMVTFNALLNTFGFGSGSVNTSNRLSLPSTMSSSERAGHTVITSLKDFIRGLKNGF